MTTEAPAIENPEEPQGGIAGHIALVERWLIAAVIIGMAILPIIEIVARVVFRSGIPGSLLYTQQLTLWVAFLGALLAAAGPGKHLAMRTGDLFKSDRLRRWVRAYVAVLSAVVCALIAYASAVMVQADAEFPRELPGGVPEWISELVMPAAMGLLVIRFLWGAGQTWVIRLAAALTTAAVCTGLAYGEGVAESLVVPGAVLIVAGLVFGTPVFVAMAGLAMLLFFSDGSPVASVPVETYRLVASPTLPAIPLLTVAGFVLAAGGAPGRLLRLARAAGGWMPGGMSIMVCVVCAGFTAFTGGSGVTILALGGLFLPMLIAEKYPDGFSLGLVTCSGSLGLLLPPSLPVILYAVVAKSSVRDLFVAGLVPGILLITLVAIYGAWVGRRAKTQRHPFTARELGKAAWAAKWELAIPAVVLMSILSGWATILEASAVAVVFAIVSQTATSRDLHPLRDLPKVMVDGAALIGAVLILLGMAMGLTSYLVEAEVPAALVEWTRTHIESPIVFLLLLNVVLLVLGSVLEIYSAIVILAPLLAPLGPAYGIDPLHLGIVFLANLELGFLLPPMGLNLLLSSTRFGEPLAKLYKVTLPFLLISLVGLMLVTYVPAMTTGVLEWFR